MEVAYYFALKNDITILQLKNTFIRARQSPVGLRSMYGLSRIYRIDTLELAGFAKVGRSRRKLNIAIAVCRCKTP